MINVLWITQSSSPYKNKLFLELNKYINLTVLLIDKKNINRNSEWIIDNKNINIVKVDNNYKDVIDNEAVNNDILIDSVYISKQGRYATKRFNSRNKITIMFADGGIPKNRGMIINKIMSSLMKQHDCFLSSSEYTDMYYNYYGVIDNIYHYRFTSLTSEDMKRHEIMFGNKEVYRKKLGINKFTFLSVGQPIYRKGYDILIRAIETVNDLNFIVVGGKPLENVLNYVKCKRIQNVKFIGILNEKDLEEYYAACDAFILPTREDVWGLVINEALSFNLPVITSNNCVAGLHFKDNCVIVKNEDIQGYKEAIKKINAESNNFECVKEYTIENSALDIFNNLKVIYKKGKNEE